MDKGEASRRRLLDAAAVEFAAHGIAGARVDRISLTARVSKAQLYAYYKSKEALFDAVLDDLVGSIIHDVPLTAEDLPKYAVRLYDACVASPQLVRLAAWARLERTPTGPLFLPEVEEAKLAAIAGAQRAGVLDGAMSPADLHSMLIGLAMTWSPISLTHAAAEADGDAAHGRRRASLATVVRRAFENQTDGGLQSEEARRD